MIMDEINIQCSGCAYFHITGKTLEDKRIVCDKGKFSIPMILFCDKKEAKE